jgi:hypothetical protein
VGDPLSEFRGVLTGVPSLTREPTLAGEAPTMVENSAGT